MSFIGPEIPKSLLLGGGTDSTEPVSGTDEAECGPGLPLDHQSATDCESAKIIGPTLPPPNCNVQAVTAVDQGVYGPPLPPGFVVPTVASDSDGSDEEEADVSGCDPIGPQIPDSDDDYEQRLALLKQKQALDQMGNKREAWMTELPEQLRTYGLQARGFSKRGVLSEADSTWTDSPLDRLKKSLDSKESSAATDAAIKNKASEERDSFMEAQTQMLNKNRTESLMEMHNKKRKLDEKDAEGGKERKPFDRERDLKIVKLNSADKALAQKALDLGSRFAHGQSQKYL